MVNVLSRLPIELRVPPWKDRSGRVSLLKSATLIGLLVPAAWMIYHWQAGSWLIPQATLTYWSGVWALVVLLLTLFVTPLRRIFGWRKLILIRRMIGVGALAYTVAHIVIYFWLRMWDPAFIINEMVTRLTLIVATLSTLGLVVLGVTSFDAAIHRMGAAAWDRLHRITYWLTGLAVFHFLLSPGAQAGRPFLMVGLFAWLLAWRILDRRRLGESVPSLVALGVGASLLTAALEVIWPAVVFDMDPLFLLQMNFSLLLGLSPGWSLLLITMSIALGAALAQQRRSKPLRVCVATWAASGTLSALVVAFLVQMSASQDVPKPQPGPTLELRRAALDTATHAPGSPEYYVDARQGVMTGMQDLGAHIDLGAQTAEGEAYEQLLEEAEALVGLMRTVPLLFPEGTSPEDLLGVTTHASPAIWEDAARFEALWAEAQTLAESMVLAGNGPELFDRFEKLENVCTACHAEFLSYDPFQSLGDAPLYDEALFDFSDRAGD